MKRPLNTSISAFDTYILDDYSNIVKHLNKYLPSTEIRFSESEIQNAICKFLSEKVRSKIPSKLEARQTFTEDVKRLCKQDLDAVEFKSKYKKRESKLKTYFKLNFALDDINSGDYGFNQAILLMATYLKLTSKPSPDKSSSTIDNPAEKTIKYSQVYKYLNHLCKQEKLCTINELTDFTLCNLANELYSSIAMYNYEKDANVIEPVLAIRDNDLIIFNQPITCIDLEHPYEEMLETIDEEFETNFNQELYDMDYTLNK